LDGQGNPHIVYRGWTGGVFDRQRHAVRSDSTWTIEQLSMMATKHELVLDSSDEPHITCRSGSYIYYITKVGGAWTYTAVGRAILGASGAPLALDRRGDLVMVFIDYTSHWLLWVYRQNGVWNQEYVDPDGEMLWGYDPALALGPAGNPRITRQVRPTLQYVEGVDNTAARVPQTIVVDGVNDFLPANRIESEPGDTEFAGIDIGDVYVTNDASHLFVGFSLGAADIGWIQLGVAVDTYSPEGGTEDPWQRRIEWNSAPKQPDYEFYVGLDNGQQAGYRWDGDAWAALPPAGAGSFVWGAGVTFNELAIPLSTLEVGPGAPINVEAWVTQSVLDCGPLDCAANDAVQLSTPEGTLWSTDTSVPMTRYHGCRILQASNTGAAPEAVTAFTLAAPSPNPAGGRSLVAFTVPARNRVRLTLNDLQGRRLAVLADDVREAGRHTAVVPARDLPAGMYFVRMQAAGVNLTRRLVVVK
jgi:hypothetical protein